MKKLISRIIVVLVLLFSFTTPCLAEFQPDPSRWVWIDSDDTTGIWFDKKTVSLRQEYGRYQVSLWILEYKNTPAEEYNKILYNVDINGRKLYIIEALKYDMQGNLIDSAYADKYSDNAVNVIPDTYGELIYLIATLYVPHKA